MSQSALNLIPKLIDSLTHNFNILVAGSYEEDFIHQLSTHLTRLLDIEHKIHFIEKISPNEHLTYLRASDLVLIINHLPPDPLLKKFLENLLPIVTLNIKNPPSFVAVSVENEPPERIAALIALLWQNRALRRKLVQHQLTQANIDPPIYIQIEGSFDSSYSLAIVNREMARALNKIYPSKVSLYSTDGYGDFPPKSCFLKKNPDITELHTRSSKAIHAPVVLRNPYPPRVYDMKGLVNAMTSYGWEESEYPKPYLRDLNRYLDFLPVMSPYVKKVMIDNGIEIPVFVVGLGADHILRISPEKYPLKTKKSFKFLHISSCFPRKGIDVLLSAYTSAFTAKDDVVLIIKTFPNPHNEAKKLIAHYKNTHPNPPEIELINKDIPDSQLVYLYQIADAFVLPSRGEGFGLPAAEAMLFKKPVITTAYGGQTYFCKEDTAFLVDFTFEKARTHMDLPFSVWVTPNASQLAKLMRYLYENIYSPEVQQKVEKAYALVSKEFTWRKSASRLVSAIKSVESVHPFTPLPLKKRALSLCWISSWNSKCGIAKYSEYLITHFSPNIKVTIIANRLPSSEILCPEKEKNVCRVWNFGIAKDVEAILSAIENANPHAVVIQHHYTFFRTNLFGILIKRIKEELGFPLFITIHSTKSHIKKLSLRHISKELNLADRIFVHSIRDLNIMKSYGVIDNLTLFPHGIEKDKDRSVDPVLLQTLRKTYGISSSHRVIGTFGFLRKHKGTIELITAFSILKNSFPELKLLLLTALYPAKDSHQYFNECRKFISNLPLSIARDIIFIVDFIPEEVLPTYLSLMDVVVYPYREINESSSAAVRYGLSLKKPIVVTPAEIFEDISDAVVITEDFSPTSIAFAVEKLLKDPEFFKSRLDQIKKLLSCANWPSLASRLENIIKHITFYS